MAIERRPDSVKAAVLQAKEDADAAANVGATNTPDETQNHCYSEDACPGHIQTSPVHQGDHAPRQVEVLKTGARHVTQPQKADGQKQQANVDREKSVMANRKATEAIFESHRQPHHSSK